MIRTVTEQENLMVTFRNELNNAIADALREPVDPGEVIDAVATAADLTEEFEAAIAPFFLDQAVPTHIDYMLGIWKVVDRAPTTIAVL